MIESLLSLSRVAVIAHRGGAKLRPENTFAAFDHAVSLGVDGLECDVHLSRDRDVVVIHDATLDRTTSGVGPVDALTADELARIDAGFYFGAADGYPFRGLGLRIPRLRDLLERFQSVPIVIEMKGDRPDLAERVIEVVRRARADDRVILAGFSQITLDAARHRAPDLVTSASREEASAAIGGTTFWSAKRPASLRLFQVPYRTDDGHVLRADFVQTARKAGLPVHAWIVDEPSDMRRLIGDGVTGIITDRPDLALALIKAKGRRHKA